MGNLARTLARRRRRRAAAMVEALVVIPFFIVIFASMMYVGGLYGEKQRTLRSAKQAAWTYAMGNCSGSTSEISKESSGNPQDLGLNGTEQFKGQGGDVSMTKDFGVSVSTVKGKVTASKIIGGATNNLSTTTRVQCNETPINGDVLGVFKFGWKLLTNW